jgi:hypothetical protein
MECICGNKITTIAPEGICGNCGRSWKNEWKAAAKELGDIPKMKPLSRYAK